MLRCHGDVVQHGVVSFFGFGRWDIADWLQQRRVIEPVDPKRVATPPEFYS